MTLRIEYPTGARAEITAEQRTSVERIAERYTLLEPIIVSPLLGGGGCIMIQAGRNWFGVEPDGYAHT